MLGKGEVLGGENPRFRVEGLSPPKKLHTCEETHHKLKLNDGSLRIFLNTSTKELTTLDAKLQAFYHYIQEGAVESDLAKNISDKITTLKNDSMTRRYYVMTSLKIADLQRDAYTEGREEGISLGREEGISLGREEGISLGREEGISIGAYEKALETAQKLIARGDSPEEVAQLLDLPLLEVQDLMRGQN